MQVAALSEYLGTRRTQIDEALGALSTCAPELPARAL